jgi:hypothetical protein
MKWIESSFNILYDAFHGSLFSSSDAVKLLGKNNNYSRGTVYRLLHELTRMGALEKLGTGIYRFSNKKFEIKPAREKVSRGKISVNVLKRAKKLLEKAGVEFMITGPSVLLRYHHHFPRRLVHLIYVIKGAGDSAVDILRKNNMTALLNPSESDLELILKNLAKGDVIVVREYSKLIGNVGGVASLERALVDTYFEGTRGRIPYSRTEIARINVNALRKGKVNITRLFTLANRRGVEKEMRAIVKAVFPEVPVKGDWGNEHIMDVLHVLRSR